MPGNRDHVLLSVVRALAIVFGLGIVAPVVLLPQEATEDRVKGPGWWPTKSVPSPSVNA